MCKGHACDLVVLSGDIGGTNARFRLTCRRNKEKVVLSEKSYKVENFSTVQEAVQLFLSTYQVEKIDRVVLAVAGPEIKGRIKVTNSSWVIEIEELAAFLKLKVSDVKIVNDFIGTGYGLNSLSSDEFEVLQKGERDTQGLSVFVGVGTGLGIGFASFFDKKYEVFPTEGGHTSFAPKNDLQVKLFHYLREKYPQKLDISVEFILSGRGVVDLYDFLSHLNSVKLEEKRILKFNSAEAIFSFASSNPEDKIIKAVLTCFVEILAARIADLALSFLPNRGIYLVGAIIKEALKQDFYRAVFLANFLKKDKFRDMVEKFPIYLVKKLSVGLDGAEYIAYERMG